MKRTDGIIACLIFLLIFAMLGLPIIVGLKTITSAEYSQSVEPNFTDVIQQTKKGVVYISCPQWQGSGFVIGPHLIATARHCVEGVEDFEITFDCGNKVRATRAISAKNYDIGFIWVDEKLPDELILELGSIEDCKLGQDIFIVGSPLGYVNFNSVTRGIVSGLNRDWDEIDPYTGERYGWSHVATTDAAAHPGNSGCGVFNINGEVLGVIVGRYSPSLVCFVPVSIFSEDLDEILLMFTIDKYKFEEAVFEFRVVKRLSQ